MWEICSDGVGGGEWVGWKPETFLAVILITEGRGEKRGLQ